VEQFFLAEPIILWGIVEQELIKDQEIAKISPRFPVFLILLESLELRTPMLLVLKKLRVKFKQSKNCRILMMTRKA
jgi:hypothetical protein